MEDSNKNNLDPFDPFAEKEEIFESKNIKTSKAGRLNLKKKSPSRTANRKKKLPLRKRINLALKNFSEREDKKKIFFLAGVSLALAAGVVVVYLNVIKPRAKEIIEQAEVNTVGDEIEEISNFVEQIGEMDEDEFENNRKSYIKKIEKELEKLDNTSQKYYSYLSALLLLYGTEDGYEKRIKLSEEILNNPELELSTRGVLLLNLKTLYSEAGLSDKVKETEERFLDLPDSNSLYVDGGVTINDMKNKIKVERDARKD